MRLRFAPSPTGFLHVGGARTALFNWLLARRHGGTFVLRIEDTDRARSSDEHTRAILDGLSWLGLSIDEGPYFQGEGVDRHRSDALELLEASRAYRDFSDPEELRATAAERGIGHPSVLARERADTEGAGESRRRADAGEPFAVRFRVPEGPVSWDDMVHGPMTFGHADVDDLVILRSDGTPTYNMAVVSDDSEVEITHVIRGDDHLSNTPKQILLYEALGRPVPIFGHVPMILGPDGKRLSKRHGATAVGAYSEEGILPHAMVNFLALLGWNPGDEREVMSVRELIESFSMERVVKKSAVFDLQKLEWLNGQYIANTPSQELLPAFVERLTAVGIEVKGKAEDRAWLLSLIDLLKGRSRTVEAMVDSARPFVVEELVYDADAVAKHWRKDVNATADRLEKLEKAFSESPWTEEELEVRTRGVAEALGVGAGKVIHPLRVAVTGRQHSPGIFEVLTMLGRDRSLARLAHARSLLASEP